MRDRALDIILMVLFAIGGITIVIIVWTQQMPLPDRILATFIASAGIIYTVVRSLLLISARVKIGSEVGPPEPEVRKRPY